MRSHIHHKNGFTLVEALVALTILTVGLVPAFIQARNALNLSGSIRNSLVAAHLAQEGAEIARSIRDADWFAGRPFGQSLVDCATGCAVQWDSERPESGIGASNTPIRHDPATGLFQYDRGDELRFNRIVTVTPVSATELQVDVRVEWDETFGPKEYTIEYHLYDWLQ